MQRKSFFAYVRGVLAYYDLWIVFVKFAKIASGRVHHKQWKLAQILFYSLKRRLQF